MFLKPEGILNLRWKREMRTGFWWGHLKERGHWEDAVVYGRVILKWAL